MDYFSGNFKHFHLFVEPCHFISFIRLVTAGIEFFPHLPGLFRVGEQIFILVTSLSALSCLVLADTQLGMLCGSSIIPE